MGPLYTAIIHLREPVTPIIRRLVLPGLCAVRGVQRAEYNPTDAVIAVTFDADQSRLPDIVRTIEDSGSAVASVAQRKASPLHAA